MEALVAMVTDRPYVVAFLAAFLLVSGAERGGRRTLFWLVSGTFIGWLAEFSSVHNGVPFGFYTYHQANFPRELWLAGIPLFASLSFAFLTYFGFSIATTFLSPLRWEGSDLQRVSNRRVATSLRVLLLAAAITTWADMVTDPVALLGKYWFLGDLYAYHAAGVQFDVPLSNYAGWFVTSLCIVFLNQRFDSWLGRREARPPRGLHLPCKPLWSVGSWVGNCIFMLGVIVVLLSSGRVPDSVPLREILASNLILTMLFVTFAIVMIRRGLQRSQPASGEAVQ
ncbi:MAG: carotenoid biosynthesis protein [Candidatus Binatia bacterium]